jgi:hypothetical protein
VAAVAAMAGAAQYIWNFSALWLEATPPASWTEALKTFWFDVTKADWRETMVLRLPLSMAVERARMYAFDVEQQIGWLGAILALVGAAALARAERRRAALVLFAYIVTVLFAMTYNVGDSYVFFLPSHLMLVLLAACGLALLGRLVGSPPAVAAIALVIVGARIHRDYPALDRSQDRRPTEVMAALTAGLDDRDAILLADLNWQLQNGLHYYSRFERPEVAYARVPDVALYAPALIRDNAAIGREIVTNERGKATLEAAYGPLLRSTLDERGDPRELSDLVDAVRPGARYVVCYVRPAIDAAMDERELEGIFSRLAGQRVEVSSRRNFTAMAGIAGRPPSLFRVSERPFDEVVSLDGLRVDVRIESWLPFDTIRRMGFGHVIAARRRLLVVERGISFVELDAEGAVAQAGYAANEFAPARRYVIAATLPSPLP